MHQAVCGRRDGFALVIAILGILVLSGLTLASLKTGTDEASAARATRVSAPALYAAERGVRETQLNWPVTIMEMLEPGDSACLEVGGCGAWSQPVNSSQYRRVIHRRDDGTAGNVRLLSLTSEGRTNCRQAGTACQSGPLGGEATVQTWITLIPGGPGAPAGGRFTAAIKTKGSITLSGNSPGSSTSSYDSRLGDYDAPLAGGGKNSAPSGNVITGTTGKLNMSGGATINGDAEVGTYDGKSGSNCLTDQYCVTGSVTKATTEPEITTEDCDPPDLVMPGLTSSNKQLNYYSCATSQNMLNCDLTVNGAYTLASGTYTMNNFSVGGAGGVGGVVTIPSGAIVTIYLSGKLTIGGEARINYLGARTPGSLNFVGCKRSKIDPKTLAVIPVPNTSTWDIGGKSGAYMTVYNPDGGVNLNGGTKLYGAVVAKTFLASSDTSAVNFDRALMGETTSTPPTPTVINVAARSWSQLLR